MPDVSIPTRFPAPLFDRWWAAAFPESMAIHCVMALSGRVDDRRLSKAARLALDAEPILACQFVDHWFRPFWRRDPSVDDLPYFACRTNADLQADLQALLEAPPPCPLQVVLLRGEADVLCVKLDHRIGDGKALLECVYRLVDLYNRLGEDPAYCPKPNVNRDRSLRQLGGRFDAREKWRIARHILQSSRSYKQLGEWRYPIPERRPMEFEYRAWSLDAEQVRALFAFSAQRRATISQVLLAAFALAALDVLPPSPDALLPVNMAIDLRRYLPGAKAATLCNLTGNAVIAFDPRAHTTMDAAVRTIRDQMKTQQKYLGLPGSSFALETLPGIRHVVAMMPYLRLKRALRRQRERALSKDFTGSVILLTYAGDLDHDRLRFGDVDVTDGFCVAGMSKVPGILGLSVSGFRGAMTLYLGVGPNELVTRLTEHVKALLRDAAS